MDVEEITSLEEKEKKILEFEENYTKTEQLLKEYTAKCQDLEEKLRILEEKSSKDEVVAAQLNELHSKIEEYEHTIQELQANNERLRNAISQLQEENIQMEDELNSIKTEHGDINELKAKLKVLEETVITQQKELVEKDKILKGEFITDDGCAAEGGVQHFIVGKEETLKEFNHLIENTSYRLSLVIPTIEDLEQLNLQLDAKINLRIATSLDLSKPVHKKIANQFSNAEFRNYSGKDRWVIERDGQEICIVALSENKDYIGFSSTDSKIVNLFSKLLTEAWLKGEKVAL
ncbi:MAG: hypothetical protein ACTSQI_06350 [Candidatus Helarchaeota archaeon]